MDYMMYAAIVYYIITEIGGRIVEYNSGLNLIRPSPSRGHGQSDG